MPAVVPKLPLIWKGVCVEEIGRDAAALGDGGAGEGEEVLEQEVDVAAVVEAGPIVDLPGAGPAGVAAVAAVLQGLAGGGAEVGSAAPGDPEPGWMPQRWET
jgi:hypothetical protein